uniref:Uncharacterized protein n=1 Tax=Macrostomum lignano TaxID=282301 RepID=A0A1I8FF74_9PLAT
MDSPMAEDYDQVFMSSQSSSVSNSCANKPASQLASEDEEQQLTITRERCNSIVRRSLSWQPRRPPPTNPHAVAAAAASTALLMRTGEEAGGSPSDRSRNPSENGTGSQLQGLRKPIEEFHRQSRSVAACTGLCLLRCGTCRAQSTSDSPSSLVSSSTLPPAQYSATSNLVRLQRSAKGQSAPNLSTACRVRRNSNRLLDEQQHRVGQQERRAPAAASQLRRTGSRCTHCLRTAAVAMATSRHQLS